MLSHLGPSLHLGTFITFKTPTTEQTYQAANRYLNFIKLAQNFEEGKVWELSFLPGHFPLLTGTSELRS